MPDTATQTTKASAYEMDADLAEYAAAVAKALASVKPAKPPYGGEFYVSEAVISYDGDPVALSVVADEHGGYGIRVQMTPTGPAGVEHA